MPHEFPEAIRDMFNIEETRKMGIILASKMVLEHRYNAAKDVLAKLLELCPNDIEVMTLHANIYSVEGKFIEAENKLAQVLLLNPNYPLALYFLGVVCHEKGEYEKAIHMYQTALQYFSESEKMEIADAYQNLGCSLWEVKRKAEALEAWKTSLKYNPRQKYVKENLKKFTNEYGMPKSPGFDDYYAFTDIKNEEYLAIKGKKDFDNIEEANIVLHKIMDAWNTRILPKYGEKLNLMKTKDKVKLFKDTKVFE